MSSFQEGTRFNRMFLWCFQTVKHGWNCVASKAPPDLVIEVVSPSNRGRDLLTKRALYARAGVREYWLVNPEARTIEILALDRDAFHLAVAASGDETPVSPLLGQLPITANELFADIDA
jgi:Uma2 family endonuclease